MKERPVPTVRVKPDPMVGHRLYVEDPLGFAPAGPRLGRGEPLPIEHYHSKDAKEAEVMRGKLQDYLDRNWNRGKRGKDS